MLKVEKISYRKESLLWIAKTLAGKGGFNPTDTEQQFAHFLILFA